MTKKERTIEIEKAVKELSKDLAMLHINDINKVANKYNLTNIFLIKLMALMPHTDNPGFYKRR